MKYKSFFLIPLNITLLLFIVISTGYLVASLGNFKNTQTYNSTIAANYGALPMRFEKKCRAD